MDNSIVTLDKQGNFKINDEGVLVFNLYRTVYSMPNVGKELYRERMSKTGMLLTGIRHGFSLGVGADILNLAWGVYKIGKIEGNEFDMFFKKESSNLQAFEGYSRVLEYVNTCLTPIHATIGFQIHQEKMPASAHKTVEQLDKMSEMISNNEKAIERMVMAARDAIKDIGFRLDEAEQKLKEREEELTAVKKELDALRAEKAAAAEQRAAKEKKPTEPVKLDAKKEAIRDAVIMVLEAKDERDCYEFKQVSQWDGIYMVLKERKLYKGTQKDFGSYIGSLGIPNLRMHLPGKDLMRSGASGKMLATWEPKGAGEKKVKRVAELFKVELAKLLPE